MKVNHNIQKHKMT
jgi:hypothetical protein